MASNRVAKTAAAAPYAAGGLGVVLLGLGAFWALSQVKGPLADIFGGAKTAAAAAKTAIEAPPDFLGGLFGEEKVTREIPLGGFLDLPRIDAASGAAYWFAPSPDYEPDVPTSFSIVSGEIIITNPNPGIPLARGYEFDVPTAPRQFGTAVRGNIGEAIDPSEYYTPFEGQVPFGGPKFDIRPWKW